MTRVNVTKTFLPPLDEYENYLKKIWQTGQITNQGPLLNELEQKLKKYFDVSYLHIVSNGTMALQLALHSLDILEGEVITTPFTYVATTSAILWEQCRPVYVDIEPQNFCIDVNKIEAAITPKTKAIMPVHVFGNVCNIEAISEIAQKHDLKIIYDAAHAFGITYKGKSIFTYGDISVGSFHATKLFHTIEGGCLAIKDKGISDKIELQKRFGHNYDEHTMLGINAKATEFQAAMGLANLKYVEYIKSQRKKVSELYDDYLSDQIKVNKIQNNVEPNYSYYPVTFKNEKELMRVIRALEAKNIFPRRYFYPSLNSLPYLKSSLVCPVSEDISHRIACLPLYVGLEEEQIKKICQIINNSLF